MTIFYQLFNFILNLDTHLLALLNSCGAWTYVILFCIIFCETGVIFTAFLPGDSLLFAAGALTASASNVLNVHCLFISLAIASIAGNCVNYTIGKWLGPKVFRSPKSWLFNQRYIENAHRFYERYGGKTIIIARFIPIVRTFAPFIAGIGYMTFRQFVIYTVIGSALWIGLLVYASFLFGNIPVVKSHFSLVIIAIIVLSITPALVELLRRKVYSNAE